MTCLLQTERIPFVEFSKSQATEKDAKQTECLMYTFHRGWPCGLVENLFRRLRKSAVWHQHLRAHEERGMVERARILRTTGLGVESLLARVYESAQTIMGSPTSFLNHAYGA